MKIILILIFILLNIQAEQALDSSTCKGCHPTIYSEFYNSSHKKSSIFENKVHKGMWDLHPDKQKESYSCAKCHTPTDLELLKNLEENKIFILTQFKLKLENVLEEKFYNKKIEHIELTQEQKDFKKDFFDKY